MAGFAVDSSLRNRAFESWRLNAAAAQPERSAAPLPAPVRQGAGDSLDYLRMRAAALRNHLIAAGDGRLYALLSAGPGGALTVCRVGVGGGGGGTAVPVCIERVAGEARELQSRACRTPAPPPVPPWMPPRRRRRPYCASAEPGAAHCSPHPHTPPSPELAQLPPGDAGTRPAEAALDASLAAVAAPSRSACNGSAPGAAPACAGPAAVHTRLLVSEGCGDLRLVTLGDSASGEGVRARPPRAQACWRGAGSR